MLSLADAICAATMAKKTKHDTTYAQQTKIRPIRMHVESCKTNLQSAEISCTYTNYHDILEFISGLYMVSDQALITTNLDVKT